MPSAPNVTELLLAWQAGDHAALDRLLPAIQPELRRIARRHMAGERRGHVLQPTALVNEAYLRLAASSDIQWQGRAHFFAVAAQVMRRILVDYARERARQTRRRCVSHLAIRRRESCHAAAGRRGGPGRCLERP
jgi:RNA polymerase sigma factor (TIGR02999 family)